MLNKQEMQQYEIIFYKNPSITSSINLIKNYIINDKFHTALEFISLMPEDYQNHEKIRNLKQLIIFSMKHYWQRNKQKFMNKVDITQIDMETLANVAFLTNNGDEFLTIAKINNYIHLSSNYTIQKFIKMSNSLTLAETIFKNVSYENKDIYIISAMIFAYAKNNQEEMANKLFESIPTTHFNNPGYILSCEMMLLAFLKNNNTEAALRFFQAIEKNSKLSKSTLLTMIKYLWKQQEDISYYIEKIEEINTNNNEEKNTTQNKIEIEYYQNTCIDEVNGVQPDHWVLEQLLLKHQITNAIQLLITNYYRNISSHLRIFLNYFAHLNRVDHAAYFLYNLTTNNSLTGKSFINTQELILNHIDDILEIFTEDQVIKIHRKWQTLPQSSYLHNAFLEYFNSNNNTRLVKLILSEQNQSKSNNTMENINNLRKYIKEKNWTLIKSTYKLLKNKSVFIRDHATLAELIKYVNINGFYNFGYSLIKTIDLSTIFKNNYLLEQIYNFCLLTKDSTYFKFNSTNNKPKQLTELEILYQRTNQNNYQLENSQSCLMHALCHDQQKALEFMRRYTPRLQNIIDIIDYINPFFIDFFSLFNQQLLKQELRSHTIGIHSIFFRLENGSSTDLLTHIDELNYPPNITAEIRVQALYINQGFEAAQSIYQQEKNLNGPLNIYTKVFLTILAKAKMFEDALNLYEELNDNLESTSIIHKIAIFCLRETNRIDELIELLIKLNNPENLDILLENDPNNFDIINVALENMPTTHLTYFFKIKELLNTNELQRFVTKNFDNLNQESANLILYSSSSLNELIYWIKNFASQIKNQTTFLIIMNNLLINNYNKPRAIRVWNQIRDKINLTSNISARFLNTKLKLKYNQSIEIPERANSYFWQNFLKKLNINKLIEIYRKIQPNKFINYRFFNFFTKRANKHQIMQLQNQNNFKIIIKCLFKNQKFNLANQLLQESKTNCNQEEKDELKLQYAVHTKNQAALLSILKKYYNQVIPVNMREIVIKAAHTIWNPKIRNSYKLKLSSKTPELFTIQKQTECKKSSELIETGYLAFEDYSNDRFVTPLNFQNILKILNEIYTKHQNQEIGFDFKKTQFTCQFNKVILHVRDSKTTTCSKQNKAEDIYNFGIWCINNFLATNSFTNIFNITDFKHNVTEEIWCMLMLCINEDYELRPSIEEIIEIFTRTNNMLSNY